MIAAIVAIVLVTCRVPFRDVNSNNAWNTRIRRKFHGIQSTEYYSTKVLTLSAQIYRCLRASMYIGSIVL